MSHDQRPSRVRVVASRDATAAAAATASTGAPLRSGDVVATPNLQTGSGPVKRGMMVPSLIFCMGCALGGAGLGAVLLAR